MTKPLPYGCIKKIKNTSTIWQLNEILDSIDQSDTVGYIFTVDIRFKGINEKTLLFNKLQYLKKKKNRSL